MTFLRIPLPFGTTTLLALIGLIPAAAPAATILAQLGTDFRSVSPTSGQTSASFNGGLGILDTVGLGYWNYYESGTINPKDGTNVLLTWGSVGNAGHSGFGGNAQGGSPLPAISASNITASGVVPATRKDAGRFGPHR